ncbi:DNA primase [Chloroflexota bacterium]
MSVVDEVKQRTDIVELIGQYTPLTKSGRTFRGLCPFHSEKRPSFFVYPDQQSWHCFGACNTGGDAFSFIMRKETLDFGEALRLLADRAGVTISARSEQETKGKDRLYQANQAAARYFHNLLLNSPAARKAQQYLERRGVSSPTIAAFQLGFSLNSREALKQHLAEQGYTEKELIAGGLTVEIEGGKTRDRFHNHLMFPILDSRERVTGFGARVLDDSLPKYINSPQTPIFDKSGTLYGINLARNAIRQQEQAIIVEGYMDAITAHQHGFLNVVASMGTAVTEKQIDTIRKLSKHIAFALDADAAGEEAMLRSVGYENSMGTEVNIILLPEGKDPDEVIKEEPELWQQLVAQAIPVIDYTFNSVTAKLDLTTEKDKSLSMDKLLPIVKEIRDDRRRDHYIDKLAKLMGASYKSIEAVLSRIKADRRAKESKPQTIERALRPILSNPVEEYCLALLLQHPELKAGSKNLSVEYFESSQNREIFAACQRTEDWSMLKEELDAAIHEHFESLVNKSLPATQVYQRWDECTLRLLEQHLRRLEARRTEMLVLEAQSGGSAAELAKLEEQGIETSVQLRKVLSQKSQIRAGVKGGRNGFE